ncbi:MAG: hypothetical protein DMF62_02530 [Acidobacteria bacterium]|nr:MAG: hypothetical protein DMF62_02530 [Acidobacteriota bacterium]
MRDFLRTLLAKWRSRTGSDPQRYYRVIPIFGGNYPRPNECEHQWSAPFSDEYQDEGQPVYKKRFTVRCPKCRHDASVVENERGHPISWWRARREAYQRWADAHPETERSSVRVRRVNKPPLEIANQQEDVE